MSTKRILIGITGASGAIYATHLIRASLQTEAEVFVVASHAGKRLLLEETNTDIRGGLEQMSESLGLTPEETSRLKQFPIEDIGAPPASGSWPLDAMAIVPCSMRTLSAVAQGLADNLITRAADVCIKENRRLVLTPRECPLSAIHLENMLKLSQLGIRIVPPIPAFYRKPESIEEIVDFTVEKIMVQLDITKPQETYP